jgi:hypothetical protein
LPTKALTPVSLALPSEASPLRVRAIQISLANLHRGLHPRAHPAEIVVGSAKEMLVMYAKTAPGSDDPRNDRQSAPKVMIRPR